MRRNISLALGLATAGVFLLLFVLAWQQTVASYRLNSTPSAKPSPSVSSQKISGLIIPHHDLVKAQRQALLKEARQKMSSPQTIILISPNHYDQGQSSIQTTKQTWGLDEGSITANSEVINALLQAQVAHEEPNSFANEHGIKLVLGDLHQAFPQASLVPLILKMATTQEEVKSLHDVLLAQCAQCLMVASVDFSHYQPALLAELHDDLTLRALQNLDASLLLDRAEVDSPSSLALLTLWATSQKTLHFVLQNHTDSGVLVHDLDGETTTHIFGWYEQGERVVPEDSVNFLIGGDMMFGRSIAHTFLAKGLWTSLDQLGERVFWGTDAGIVNLEGPVSDTPVPDNVQPNNLIFNFPPETIPALHYLHVNGASQANNHSANAGAKGLATTRKLLLATGIQPFGGPGDDGIDKMATFKGQNLTLHVIGVHTLASTPDLKPLIQKLKQDPQARVLVFPHWGAEYQYKHGASQAKLAHDWVDAGADVVIGAHPHVIEDSELYKGRPIFYSMGNLLFDQDFSKETQQGLLVAGQFKNDGFSLFSLPIKSSQYKPSVMRGAGKATILSQLYDPFAAQKQTKSAGEVLFFPN